MTEIDEQVYRDAAKAMVTPDYDADEDRCFEWHPCARCPQPSQPCACAGDPWPSPAVRAAVESAYQAGWRDAEALLDRETTRVRAEDWPAKVGIEYVQGVEHAAIMLERHLDHVVAHHEDQTFAQIADVKRGEDR